MTDHLTMFADLPPLWATEARETAEIVLPIRFASRWHNLSWYPTERSGDVLFGLTLVTVPAWRHFHVTELTDRHGDHPVLIDRTHRPAPAPEVPALAGACLLDLTPFHPTKPRLP